MTLDRATKKKILRLAQKRQKTFFAEQNARRELFEALAEASIAGATMRELAAVIGVSSARIHQILRRVREDPEYPQRPTTRRGGFKQYPALQALQPRDRAKAKRLLAGLLPRGDESDAVLEAVRQVAGN